MHLALLLLDLSFRWAVQGAPCQTSFDERSTEDRCVVTQHTPKPFTIVAFPPSASDKRIQITRYDGDHAGAPHAWTSYADLGGKPVVLIVDTTAYIAAVDHGVARIAAFDTATGHAGTTAVALDKGAADLQLEARDKHLIAYVLCGDGSGHTVQLDPATLAVISTTDVPARAIRQTMRKGAQSADYAIVAKPIEARWDGPNLVVRGPSWSTTLLANERFRWDVVTLHVTADRVLATVHNEIATGTQAFGIDPKTGTQLWHISLTGIGPIAHSKYHNLVAAYVDGDLLVVQSIESGGPFVCTVAIADGRELACVDQLPESALVSPTAPTIRLPELPPPHPIGPQIKTSSCKKSASPARAFEQNGIVDGMLHAKVVSPSASCKPKLGGGIAGDKIDVEVYDLSQKPGPPVCECTFVFEQAVNPESTTVVAHVRGGIEIAREPLKK